MKICEPMFGVRPSDMRGESPDEQGARIGGRLRNIALPPPARPAEIEEGRIWADDEGGIMTMHYWHRWFAWRPVWLEDHGWVWLRTIERRFSTRSTKERTTIAAHHRLIGTGRNIADANSKNPLIPGGR